MSARHVVIAVVTVAVSLLVGCQSSSSSESGEILYILDGASVTTYTINPATLEPSTAGSPVDLLPASSFLLQLVPSPNGRFLYVLWNDSQQREYLSVFATDKSGVPQSPAVQELTVSSLSQLNIYSSAEFAYAMELSQSASEYVSTVLLFPLDSSGMFAPTGTAQGTYGPASFPTSLCGISPDGTQIYLVSEVNGTLQYLERTVNEPGGS